MLDYHRSKTAMNINVTLTKRQKQFVEFLAWGASYKEIADFFRVTYRTVDNTLRNAKERIGLNKVAELSAWWFCTNYNISFDLSPIAKKYIASGCLCLFFFGEVAVAANTPYTARRTRRARTEYRARRHETSINQPYII